MEEDSDLMVRFPRIVYSLRDKKVCGIACGGLHNAVWTETGHAYTWGCSDNGSLGRVGDEATPLLVQGLADAQEIITGMSCGDGQTIAVSTTGNVWGCYIDKEGKKFFNPTAAGTFISMMELVLGLS
jgi:alpha-tubulin suppressor-like RCC1 family protein